MKSYCVFLKYGSLVVHGLNPTFCLADRLLPSNAIISSYPNHIMFLKTYERNDSERYDLETARCFKQLKQFTNPSSRPCVL